MEGYRSKLLLRSFTQKSKLFARFIHYAEPRVMTVRECARLQTFPDWFEFKGPYTTGSKQRVLQVPRYTQVGNAVPPLFAELAGEALKGVLGRV